ncbi:P-loop containing nucleoside triphosphate hydrolases superfamily protein [Actinidia rufa]|uniref:P-loop containing nucleoside triphosphate hydrolases superfamily protein n=1 Tax=Actinidia rufa TaxID=165716 RepID=A0A7J0DWF5_9ERIC|nr:P-loop containing nucleoside triphosphate hydrolases superfamily protein [Actinidia rufa]
MEKICVAVRVRPPMSDESSNGTFWKVEDNRISLHKTLSTPITGASYTFDYVFDQDCRNQTVYELLTKDIIHAAVEGFNGTAFAYGQTSSGKTFTMNGSENDPGIIHLAVKDIFTKIQMTNDREFLIRVSYMEIYNEEINDLFAVENQKLQIHESLERGVFVAGLREEIVNSAEQVLKLIQSGEVNRHFGETNMNVRSSRSHTIFRMVIESKGKETSTSAYSSLDDAIRVSVGHIPYRDSKLTRILQPALGGNAKTSIICTLAPEEVHVEETKGTLQFASRAKRITNCVQVNEILTDAALLKRQKLEIEELRRKLQGSQSEVLEQEVLKLRNDMLKYELEREKLATELEEERKSHKEREQCIKEQQMKIENLSSLVTFSDSDGKSSQVTSTQSLKEDSSDSHSMHQEDAFTTPCFKAAPNAFVAKRSNYAQHEYSPLPDTLSNIADEDTWLKMNKGYVADLDSIHMTPARKVQSFPFNDITPGCLIENYKQEIEHLKSQLELARKEKDELECNYVEEIQMNEKLMGEISELQQETLLLREIPRQLLESVAICKDIYKDVLSILQSFVTDGKSSASKLLSSSSEIGTSLFSTLETHFSMTIDGRRISGGNNILVQEKGKMLCEMLNNTITSLVLSEAPMNGNKPSKDLQCSWEYQACDIGCTLGEEIACLKEKLHHDLSTIKEKYQSLEKELNTNAHLLEVSKERYQILEREFHLVKEERDSLLQTVTGSSQRLAQVNDQKEKVLRDLSNEVQRRKDLEDEIKQFGIAFTCRQKSLTSFQSELKSKLDKLKAQNPVSIPKSFGYID